MCTVANMILLFSTNGNSKDVWSQFSVHPVYVLINVVIIMYRYLLLYSK